MTLNEHVSLISASLRILGRHKRYIFWFWLLNLTLAEFGAAVVRSRLHAALDHSLVADRLLHGFDGGVYYEMVTRPQWGTFAGAAMPAMYFSFLFVLVTLFCLPGILDSYTSDGRPSREDFFRCCGRNLWRFIWVVLCYGIVAGVIGGALFGVHVGLVHAARKSTYELLPFYANVVTLGVIFLALTIVRIWFDLAQLDVVVRDQRAVRKSIAAAFRFMRGNVTKLLSIYVFIHGLGFAVLAGGICIWHASVVPSHVLGAFLVAQATAILWLTMRFWRRAVSAAFYMREIAANTALPAVAGPAPALSGLTRSPAPGQAGPVQA